jgi:hypothetical protein
MALRPNHAAPPPGEALVAQWRTLEDPAYRRERGPLAVLALLDSLRGSLRDYEGRVCADARAAGATWTEVGDGLGITKQAAQARYGGQS